MGEERGKGVRAPAEEEKREAEETDKVQVDWMTVAPWVAVGSLRRFRVALLGPTQ